MKLDDLHLVIQSAFFWTNSHLHAFIYKNKYLSPAFPDEGETEESELYNTLKIADLIHKKGDKVTYVYDFGDDWNHEIVLEEVLSRDELPDGKKTPLPLCTKGKRARPLEDCGGVSGYEHFVKVLNNPKHPEYEDLLNWAGPYDFEYFDKEILNEELQKENYGLFVWDDEDDFLF
jgi:hypothetical protein